MSVIAVIPARGGSTRIPHKNIKLFRDKPIIAYSILAAKASGLFDHIVVSTDDETIAVIAQNWGAIPHMRDPYYGKNEVGTQAVMRECLFKMGLKVQDKHVACCIYATAPLMSVADLSRGYIWLMGTAHSAYAFSVGTDPLQDAGQFYWGKTAAFLTDTPLIGPSTIMVPVMANRVCDINTPADWKRALRMYEALHHD